MLCFVALQNIIFWPSALAAHYYFPAGPLTRGWNICPFLTVNRKRITMERSVIQSKPAMAGLFGMCLLILLKKIAGLCIIRLSLSAVSRPLFIVFLSVNNEADLMIP